MHWFRASALSRWLFPGFAFALLLALGGCDQFSITAAKSKVEEQAKDAQNAGDYPRAVRLYESLLDGTSKTARIHYNLALIYDDKLNDPISALHHYKRFLVMSDDVAAKKEVAKFVQRLQLGVAASNADSGIMTKRDAALLKNENLKLQEQVTLLKSELAEARKRPSAKDLKNARNGVVVAPTAAEQAQKAAIGGGHTYTVQKGDTLASIARKFYNNPGRYSDIADANQNLLNGTVNLKIGEVLIIPK